MAAVLLLGATVVLATGIRSEQSIMGTSLLGKIALILFGARSLIVIAVAKVPFPDSSLPAVRVLMASLSVLFVVAVAYAAREVVRASLLRGASRWSLVAVAGSFAIALLPPLASSPQPAQFFSELGAVLMPLAILFLGIVLLVDGVRSTSSRNRS